MTRPRLLDRCRKRRWKCRCKLSIWKVCLWVFALKLAQGVAPNFFFTIPATRTNFNHRNELQGHPCWKFKTRPLAHQNSFWCHHYRRWRDVQIQGAYRGPFVKKCPWRCHLGPCSRTGFGPSATMHSKSPFHFQTYRKFSVSNRYSDTYRPVTAF